MKSNNILLGRLSVCHMPAACLKGEISEKKKETEIKSALMWVPGPRRTSEGKEMKRFSSSMPCLSDFTIKLTAGNVKMYSICAGCVCELCVRKESMESGTGR